MPLTTLLENIHQGDDAYIGDVVKISGGLMSMLGTDAVMACIVGEVAAAALAPLAIAGAIVSFLGYAIKAWIFPETKPIGLWAEHGPFGKVPFMGYKQCNPKDNQSPVKNHQAGRHSKKVTNERYIAWCEDPEEAYRALRDALFRPSIERKAVRANMAQLIAITVKVPFKTKKKLSHDSVRTYRTALVRIRRAICPHKTRSVPCT